MATRQVMEPALRPDAAAQSSATPSSSSAGVCCFIDQSCSKLESLEVIVSALQCMCLRLSCFLWPIRVGVRCDLSRMCLTTKLHNQTCLSIRVLAISHITKDCCCMSKLVLSACNCAEKMMRRQGALNLPGPFSQKATRLLLSQPGQSCGQRGVVAAPLIRVQACLKVRPAFAFRACTLDYLYDTFTVPCCLIFPSLGHGVYKLTITGAIAKTSCIVGSTGAVHKAGQLLGSSPDGSIISSQDAFTSGGVTYWTAREEELANFDQEEEAEDSDALFGAALTARAGQE